MDTINLTGTLIGREVERLFSKNPARSNGLCTNPVTGEDYVRGVDPIATQKRKRRTARFWPVNGSPLPPRATRRHFLSTSTTAKTGSERGGYWTTSSRYTLGRWMIGMT